MRNWILVLNSYEISTARKVNVEAGRQVEQQEIYGLPIMENIIFHLLVI